MSSTPPDKVINLRLSLICLLIPLVAFLFAVFNGQNEGLLGMIACFFGAIYTIGFLLSNPPFKKKHAAWSFLIGYFLSLLLFVLVAVVNLSGQQTPWFN